MAALLMATIYIDRVNAKAGKAGVDARLLMGRVMAHELGHLLLATTAHTSHGLMRATWTKSELRCNLAADWAFSAREVADLAARAPR